MIFIILTTNAAKQGELSYIQLCRQKNIDGVLVSGLNINEPYYRELMNSEIPCVVMEGEYKSKNVCGLSIDNARAAYDVTHYLIGMGHKKDRAYERKVHGHCIPAPFKGIPSGNG